MKLIQQINNPNKRARNIPTFLKKTYQILQDPSNLHVIRWANNGIGFVVIDQVTFEKCILPKYFKHGRYSSFVRQLNMYSFHKVRQMQSQNYFKHQLFNRNNLSTIAEIKRKPEKKKKKIEYDSNQSSLSSHADYKQNSKTSKVNKNIRKLSLNSNFQPVCKQDSNQKIYFYQDNQKQSIVVNNISKLNSDNHSTTLQVKTQIEFNQNRDDEASIENRIIVPHINQQISNRQLIQSKGTIFPLQIGQVSLYSLASMIK